jgi:Tol biopolymer transport system component
VRRGHAGVWLSAVVVVVAGLVSVLFVGSAHPAGAAHTTGVIAFTRSDGIHVMRPDGSGVRRVWRQTGRQHAGDLAWSPDGRTLAFVADGAIWVMPFPGGDAVRVTRRVQPKFGDAVGWMSPTWSPDGRRLAYTYSVDAEAPRDVWVMNNDGTNKRRITRTPDCEEVDVDWHPRRGQLVTTCKWGWGARHLRLMSMDGTVRSLVASKTGLGTDGPKWSPDGRRIAFAEFFPESTAISVVNVSGGTPVRLTRDQFLNWEPAWSPDGRRIAFVRLLPKGSGEIFVMAALVGSNVTRLTNNMVGEGSPAWQPIPGAPNT